MCGVVSRSRIGVWKRTGWLRSALCATNHHPISPYDLEPLCLEIMPLLLAGSIVSATVHSSPGVIPDNLSNMAEEGKV